MHKRLLSFFPKPRLLFRPQNPNSFQPGQSVQIFNNNLTYQSNQVNVKFLLKSPHHKFTYPWTAHIRIYKALVIYCIDINQLYKKGSKYLIYEFNAKDLKNLITCDFEKGQKLQFENGGQYLKIQLQSPKENKQIHQTSQKNTQAPIPNNLPTNNQQNLQNHVPPPQPQQSTTPTHPPQNHPQNPPQNPPQNHLSNSPQTPDTKLLTLTIKSEISQLTFHMPVSDINFIKHLVFESLPELFGIASKFDLQLNSIINKILANQIGEEDDFRHEHFVL